MSGSSAAGGGWPPDPGTYNPHDPDLLTFKGALAHIGKGRSTLQRILVDHGDEIAFYWGGELRISRRRLNSVMMKRFGARRNMGK